MKKNELKKRVKELERLLEFEQSLSQNSESIKRAMYENISSTKTIGYFVVSLLKRDMYSDEFKLVKNLWHTIQLSPSPEYKIKRFKSEVFINKTK